MAGLVSYSLPPFLAGAKIRGSGRRVKACEAIA
jgi:hypothetical protein